MGKKKGDIQGKSEEISIGTEVELGNGYKAVIRETNKGKRWVIADANGRALPNTPHQHYIKDARAHYNKYLHQAPPSQSIAQIIEQKVDTAEAKAGEGFADLSTAIQGAKTEQEVFKELSDYANSEAYRYNLENPDFPPITATDVITHWERHPEDAPPFVQKLMGYSPEDPGDQVNNDPSVGEDEGFLPTVGKGLWEGAKGIGGILGIGSGEGEDPQEVAGDAPEPRGRLPNDQYLGLVRQGMKDKNKHAFQNTLKESQRGRENTLGGLRERLNEREEDPEFDFRNSQQENLDQYKTDSFNQAGVLSGSMPQESIDFQWGDLPSYGKARGLWEEMSGDYIHSSSKPYDNRLHNLAAAGHALGSSSIENTESGKRRAMHREDLENTQMIHNMLLGDHRAKGETVNTLDRLASASREAYEGPLKSESDIMGSSFNRRNNRDYQRDVLDKDLTQMEMGNFNNEIQEGAGLYDLLENDRINEQAEGQNRDNQIRSMEMLAAENKIKEAATGTEFAQLRSNLWANRTNIEIALRDQLTREQQQELDKARNKEEYIGKLVSFGTKIAVTAAAIAMGQPAMAVGVWAPQAANFYKSNSGLGSSATSEG